MKKHLFGLNGESVQKDTGKFSVHFCWKKLHDIEKATISPSQTF